MTLFFELDRINPVPDPLKGLGPKVPFLDNSTPINAKSDPDFTIFASHGPKKMTPFLDMDRINPVPDPLKGLGPKVSR